MGTFSDGSYLDISATVAWNSDNNSATTIAPGGLATPVAAGSAGITASYAGITSPKSTLTVTGGHLVSIIVTPVSSGATVGVGATVPFAATGTFDDGSAPADITSYVTWSSSDGSVATISAAGVASTASTGQTTIGASLAGITGSTVLTVTQSSLAEIVILPAGTSPTVDSNGVPVQPALTMAYRTRMALAAWGYYNPDQSFHPLTGGMYTSASPSRAMVSSSGVVRTKHKSGTATIKYTWTDPASGASYTGTATLTVSNFTISQVTVAPSSATIAAGTGIQFTATAQMSDGSGNTVTQDITNSVRWTTSNSTNNAYTFATITNGGFANGIAPSVTPITITATYYQSGSTVQGTASLTVTNATLSGIAINPATPDIHLGQNQQFTAVGTFSDKSTQDLTTQAAWSSQNVAVVVMSRGVHGLAVSSGLGSTTVSASMNGVTSSSPAYITVAP
jgi:hypothetical protein